MIKQLARAIALTVAVVSFVPDLASGQVVQSTFGPGDSYNAGTGWSVYSGQSIAQGFTYSGTNAFLSQMRLALFQNSQNYTISFRTGGVLNTATTLETWSASQAADGILTLSSMLNPLLVTGDTYWLTAVSQGSGSWALNDQGAKGVSVSNNGGASWTSYDGFPSSAYDVTVNTTATPEPASLALLATGLVGLGIPVLRRRKRASVA